MKKSRLFFVILMHHPFQFYSEALSPEGRLNCEPDQAFLVFQTEEGLSCGSKRLTKTLL